MRARAGLFPMADKKRTSECTARALTLAASPILKLRLHRVRTDCKSASLDYPISREKERIEIFEKS